MTDTKELEALLASLDGAVHEVFDYFSGPGKISQARVGDWGPWEVLCHFLYWHAATAEGMESAAAGGKPRRLEASTDELNARVIAEHAGENFEPLMDQLRQWHRRLTQAARTLPNLDVAVIERLDGKLVSARERLQALNRHWRGHLQELGEKGS